MVNKNEVPQNAWDYADWLYLSGRLTSEEHSKLKLFLLQLEEEASNNAYCNEGC